MSWHVCDLVRARQEFILDWKRRSVTFAELCRRHGVSRKTGYKWLDRHGEEGEAGLLDRSRRPLVSPLLTAAAVEARVVELRGEYPSWGGRKIRALLAREDATAPPPAASTVTNILRRHGLLGKGTREGAGNVVRFERSEPNDLWQMDFKGHFALAGGARCYPLTVLDDHSRYNLVLQACGGETREVVQKHLEQAFLRYGLPRQILCDHGSPWGVGLREDGSLYGRTRLSFWLMRLGVELIHGRPRHPQTQGKEERFHRTLVVEVLSRQEVWKDFAHCQKEFDRWSQIYNEVRPHEALEMEVPNACYQLSRRGYPERLPEAASYYLVGDVLRRVQSKGEITYGNRTYAIGSGLIGETVALRESAGGSREVYYCWKKLGLIDPAQALKTKGSQNRLIRG